MSRSKRKTPVIGMCGGRHHPSEKQEKQWYHRKMRRTAKKRLKQGEEELFPHPNEVEDVWGWSKDGKQRFNPSHKPKLMRK